MSKKEIESIQSAEVELPAAELVEVPETGSLDKIRDILFGTQARDYDRRLVLLEDRLAKEMAESRDEMRRRLDSLETYFRSEIDALNHRHRTAQEQREEMGGDLGRQLADLGRQLEKRISQLDEHSSQTHRELRQQILDQSKGLNEEIQRRSSDLASALAREAQGLRSEKTDRTALASFFSEMAKRLDQNSEFGH
jgi:hypothetical protein